MEIYYLLNNYLKLFILKTSLATISSINYMF